MFRLVVAALIVSAVGGRKFQNPVLEGFHLPGVILHNGQYYMVTGTYNDDANRLPIHVSSDLQNWQEVGYALPEGSTPEWSSGWDYSPEIHQIGENDFRLFYQTTDRESGKFAIAVGVSQNVQGPYVVQKLPLQLNVTDPSCDPTLVQDGERKYLVWSDVHGILGRELNPDCLDFLAGSTPESILPNDLPWEETRMRGAWYVRRPDAWYMFYSGSSECSESYAVGVARSQNPLGPFEKLAEPILTSNDAFQTPGQVSVVPDIYVGGTVMVYSAYKPVSGICILSGTPILSQSIEWGLDDGWPFMNPQ